MTRAVRRISDQAAVLADPAAHRPDRPWWTCTAGCGDWPCEPLRGHKLATMDRVDIALEMGDCYGDMVRELGDERLAHRRLFAWHRREGLFHAPGGVF